MRSLRMLYYGMFIDYHIRKVKKIKYQTARNYHRDMSKYYYEKAYRMEYKE